MVESASLISYPLPGFNIYEAAQTRSWSCTLCQNRQFAFFSLPDEAEFFISGKEKQVLV
jgi:hypothetical protein